MNKAKTVLTGGDIVFPDGIMQDGVAVLEDGSITDVVHASEYRSRAQDHTIDCTDSFVCPGFIDLHNQGGQGFDVMDGTVESTYGLCRAHAEHGTTGLLLTPEIMEQSFRRLLPALADTVGTDTGGAAILGIHAEGPFTNPDRAGFMPPEAILPPDMGLFEEIIDCGGGKIVEMTIAPELPGSLDIIHRLAREGIVASLGHSNATLNDVLRAIDYGASHVTHFFNAMSPLHHREPGLAGTALYTNNLTVEIIADGYHIHPWVMGLILQNKSPALTCLVTDCMRVMDLEDGVHEAMGRRVTLDDDRLFMADDPTVLAGSVLTMDRAVGAVISMLGISLVEAVTMASSTPAAVIGIENNKGRIEAGYDADLTILDRTYRTRMTIVGGRVVYERA